MENTRVIRERTRIRDCEKLLNPQLIVLKVVCLPLQTEHWGLPRWCSGKESACRSRRCKRHGFDPSVGKIPGVENGNPLGILAWKIPWTEEPGRLYSPWGGKESDLNEQLSTHIVVH